MRVHSSIFGLILAASMTGCVSSHRGNDLVPQSWKPLFSVSKDCRAFQGAFQGEGEGASENPNDWLDAFKWPRKGQLPSLVSTGTNEGITGENMTVHLIINSDNSAVFNLSGRDAGRGDTEKIGRAFQCENGKLHARWDENVSGGVWSKFHADTWLLVDADHNLIVENEIRYKSVQMIAVLPVTDSEVVRFYFRFSRIE